MEKEQKKSTALMEMFTPSIDGMTAIRWFSYMNPWMDCVVLVAPEDVSRASLCIQNAIEDFWAECYETYGDAIESVLTGAKIGHVSFYDPSATEDCMEETWAHWLDNLSVPMVTIA